MPASPSSSSPRTTPTTFSFAMRRWKRRRRRYAPRDTRFDNVAPPSRRRSGRRAAGATPTPIRYNRRLMDQSPAISAPPPTRERFALHLAGTSASASFADDVRRGLAATPKFLLPHYFYDALGSALFSAICELPEYYVTRAEDEILRERGAEIAASFGPTVRLVELGSGSARKTRHLISAIVERQATLEYIPVDVDAGILTASAHELLTDYPQLSIRAICGDFREPAALFRPHPPPSDDRAVLLVPGAIRGNLHPSGYC